MAKLRFVKKKLQKNGPRFAKSKKLGSLLGTEDAQVEKGPFTEALTDATTSTTTDKILMMGKIRSMISTNNLVKENDKKTTHITLPLNGSEPKLLGNAKQLITKYGWDKDGNAATETAVEKFIEQYSKLGKRHIPKATILISRMHNPKELATLANETAKKRIDAITAVPACLKFIKANPIEPNSPIIGAITNTNKTAEHEDYRVYTLNVTQFISNATNTSGVILSDKFRTALETYDGPKEGAFRSGLREYGNKEIDGYNKALKQLMEAGTIDGNYPEKTGADKLREAKEKTIKDENDKEETAIATSRTQITNHTDALTKIMSTLMTDYEEKFDQINKKDNNSKDKNNEKKDNNSKDNNNEQKDNNSKDNNTTFKEIKQIQLTAKDQTKIATKTETLTNDPNLQRSLTNLIYSLIPHLASRNYFKCHRQIPVQAGDLTPEWIKAFNNYLESYKQSHPFCTPNDSSADKPTEATTFTTATAGNSTDSKAKLPGGFFKIEAPKK